MKALILILLFPICLFAQDEHGHNHNHIHHHKNEIGIAVSPVYFFRENETSSSLHLHYSHQLNESKFAVGLGYERIFDEHEHQTIGIVGSYRIIEPLSFNLSPGITFEGAEELHFAFHIETIYEFELGDFHLGPAIEFAYDTEDYHISAGIHIGYGF